MTNEELADHLAMIRKSSGALTPEAVVTAAADPLHPLHDHFNWDNDDAADAWRRQQARVLIAKVKVVIERTTSNGVREVEVRALASVLSPLTNNRQYVPVSEIKSDPELSAQVLEQIRRDLNSLRRKYSAYQQLFEQALAEIAEAAA